jgi:predicted nucleotidyltransferase component of viral defense system
MLYKETVEPATLGLLRELMSLDELRQFRLVGGTALSLLLGHRTSIDLDLFTDQPFNSEIAINKLRESYPVFSFKEIKSPRLFFTSINSVKVDFVHTFEKFNYGCEVIDNIRFAALPEIVALKLNAIAGRGAKKDFWDLHELLNHFSLDQMISFYHERYPQNSDMMVIKSIPYFAGAEGDFDPDSHKNTTWEQVKKDILEKFNLYINAKR